MTTLTEAAQVASERHVAPRAERHAVFRDAVLMLNCAPRRVALSNLSATGARVEGRNWSDLPRTVLLVEPTLDLRRLARVVWQRHGVAGLEFLDGEWAGWSAAAPSR